MDHILTRLYRNGLPLSPFQRHSQPRYKGWLSVGQEYVKDYNRHMLVARFFDKEAGAGTVPSHYLYDVRLLHHCQDFMIVNGFEVVSVEKIAMPSNIAVQQSWHLVPQTNEDLAKVEASMSEYARQLTELRERIQKKGITL